MKSLSRFLFSVLVLVALPASSPALPLDEALAKLDLTAPAEGTKVLIVTGIDYPGHKWKETSPVIKRLLETDLRLKVRIVEDPEALASPKLRDWDVVLLHFQNWEKPGPGAAARENLKQFVANGGGLGSVHFACGAWHDEWPEFQNILGRVWHGSGPGKAQHDPYGKFLVEIADNDHPVTRGLGAFETTDELYTCLMGDAPIHLLAHAKSKVDQKYHPQAFVRDYGKGRVFLTTLGHDVQAYMNNPAVGELLRRGCAWAAKLTPQPEAVPATTPKAQAAPPAGPPRPYPARLRWWSEARFGMFIHWGPVSLRGTEISWSRANTNPRCPNNGPIPAAVYDNLYRDFNPTNFDAAGWVGLAKAAGMKYMVLTAKHCDGFLLWHSKASDHNMAQTPFKRDICAELVKAAREQGMKIGWYFSPMDWRDPDFRSERNAAFLGRMQAELRELLGNYGPIDLLWFDWDGREPLYEQSNTYQIVKALQPEIVIDNRLDLGAGDTDRKILSTNADYYTPEQSVGAYDDQQPWESCMTISRKDQWAWGGADDGVKPFQACLDMLVRCAGGDGNMLLNIGPMPTGEIAPEQAARLKEMGAWLAKYGESIYGTRGGPFKPGDYGVSTRRGNTVYLHICDWTEDVLKLPPIPAKVLRNRLLTGGKAVVSQTADSLEISVAETNRHPVDTIVALDLDGAALNLAALDVPASVSLTTHARVTASNIYQNQPDYGPDRAVDGRTDTRWATDAGVTSAWLEVDLGKPATFNRAVIKQAFPELKRVRKFAIEYLEKEQWIPCYHGENLGPKLNTTFTPVTAQHVRLNITESTDGPTIFEFELHSAR